LLTTLAGNEFAQFRKNTADGTIRGKYKVQRRSHQQERIRIMGRLSALIGLVCLVAAATVGCDDTKPKVTVTNERSQAILGSPSAAGPTSQRYQSLPQQPRS